MKQSLASFRPSAPNLTGNHRASIVSSARRIHILQRAAGKMFHQWAEAIGHRLEEMINNERAGFPVINASLNDLEKQKQLMQEDEEEDFLDDGNAVTCIFNFFHTYNFMLYSVSSNPRGNDCPHALKLIACVVLMEITAFLREIYQAIPKTSRLSTKDKPQPWEKVYRDANRRWSMALSSMGHSQASAQSLQSIAGAEGVNDQRKISFVLHEPDNESEASSNTTLTMQGEERDSQRRPIAAVRPFLLRRGTAVGTGGSFKRRSLKLRRGTKDSKEIEADCKYFLKMNY